MGWGTGPFGARHKVEELCPTLATERTEESPASDVALVGGGGGIGRVGGRGGRLHHQARNTTKMMKKTIRMRKIFTISQRLEVTDWKYFRISVCAATTFSWASSTLASIL